MNLPNFMCIGAAKSGTTSLYDILIQHSQVFIPSFKEPHFFDIPNVYKNGLSWYSNIYFKNVKSEKCIGDFSPTYLFEAKAAKRILNDLGNKVKFIVILRNPVDRAYSHYLHSKRDAHETLPFQEALSKEKNRINQLDYLSRIRFSYVEQGLYYKMIKQYFDFFSKENFLIINFESDFLKNRVETIDKIYKFLDLEKEDIEVFLKSNQASEAKYIWLKQFMKKTGWWRKAIKQMIPSLKTRQILKNKIQRFNLRQITPPVLDSSEKEFIYKKYFQDDVYKLENLLNKKMNWDII